MDTRELHSIEDGRFMLGGISRATIRDLLNNGELPSVVIGRRRCMPAAAIASFIQRHDRCTLAAQSLWPPTVPCRCPRSSSLPPQRGGDAVTRLKPKKRLRGSGSVYAHPPGHPDNDITDS